MLRVFYVRRLPATAETMKMPQPFKPLYASGERKIIFTRKNCPGLNACGHGPIFLVTFKSKINGIEKVYLVLF